MKKNIQLLEQEGKTVVQLAVNLKSQLIISLEETHLTKPESKEVVDHLRNNLKMDIAMITGDNQHAAFKVADYLGIKHEHVIYKAYP